MKLKKYFAFLLVLCMLTSVLPYSAFAADGQEPLPEETLLMEVPNGGLTELSEEEEPIQQQPEEPVDPPKEPEAPPEEPEVPSEEESSPEPSPEVSPTPSESEESEEPENPEDPAEPKDGADTPAFYNDSYSTLQEAIDAVGSGTITLTADPLFIPEVALIDENSDIELDLNGHMLLGADIQNCGTLTICDSGDEGEFIGSVVNRGHCECDGESHEAYAGVLNIESGKIVEGTFVLEQDGDASLHAEDASVEVNVTGGKFMNVQFKHRYAYDDNGSLRYEDATDCGEVTVTGGSFMADPSALLSDDYVARMNDEGMYDVIEKPWEDEPVNEDVSSEEASSDEASSGEDAAIPDNEAVTTDNEQDAVAEGTEASEAAPAGDAEPNGDAKPTGDAEPAGEEEVPEEPEEEKTLIDLDLFISQGEGTVVVDGEEYTEDASIQVVAEEEPVLTLIPADNFMVGNVYLGMNGTSTAYSGVDEIELPVNAASFMTATVSFAALPTYNVTVSYSSGGIVKYNNDLVKNYEPFTVTKGDSVELKLLPNENYFCAKCVVTNLTTDEKQTYDDNPGTIPLESISANMMVEVTFSANKYKINYEPNGGVMTSANPDEYSFDDSKTLTRLITKDGSTFRGWYEDAQFSGSAVEEIPKGSTGDKTFYARWDYMINVTKSGNGTGSVTCDAAEVTSLKAMDYEEKLLTITPDTGCIVKSITVNGAPVEIADTLTVAPKGADADVEVIFEAASKMTVNFNVGGKVSCDGADVASGSVVSIPAGGSVAVEAAPDEYYFMNTAVLKPQTQPEIPYASESFTVNNPGEDSVLTIEFKPQTDVTLTYDADNGSDPTTVTAHAGIETTLASAPAKTGYQFTGWACDADGVIYPAGAKYTPKADTIFTAQWTQEYTITFVSNGGTAIPARKYTVLSPDYTLPTPSKTNSTFLGWFTDSGFAESSQIIVVPQGSTGNITVYAKWETHYKVSVYYTNNGAAYYQNRLIPSGSSFEVKEGEKATVRFAATTSNYNVYNVTVNHGGSSQKLGSIDTCTVGPVHEDYIINCTFAPNFMHPITGDDSHLGLWAAVMAVSALAATAAVVFIGKRRKDD